MKLWIWNWQNGGYNWCKATTRQAALKYGNNMHPNLKIDESTLREGTFEQIAELDKMYASAVL